MRSFTAILFLLSLNAVCQTQTIKVKKETPKPSLVQSESPWHVTFCNYYNGPITISDLYNPKNKLKISNNTIDLRIISFDLSWKSKGKLKMWTSLGDSIKQDIRKELLETDIKSRLFISGIKAVSKYQDTILLNSIELKVAE